MDPVWGVKGAHKSCGDHVGPPPRKLRPQQRISRCREGRLSRQGEGRQGGCTLEYSQYTRACGNSRAKGECAATQQSKEVEAGGGSLWRGRLHSGMDTQLHLKEETGSQAGAAPVESPFWRETSSSSRGIETHLPFPSSAFLSLARKLV